MNMRAATLTLFFLIVCSVGLGEGIEDVGLFNKLESKLESTLCGYTNSFVGWLENFNDEHIGKSEVGRFLHYNELKPKIEETVRQSRNMKKMGLALIPLIFHVGVTSTWMLVTTILAAKSVGIGLLLLVFKIAVSSAKMASFFTLLKAKHHHGWTPHFDHHDHHGHYRSFSGDHHHPTVLDHAPTYVEHPPSHGHDGPSYPEWTPDSSPHYTGKSITSYARETEPFSYAKKDQGHA